MEPFKKSLVPLSTVGEKAVKSQFSVLMMIPPPPGGREEKGKVGFYSFFFSHSRKEPQG